MYYLLPIRRMQELAEPDVAVMVDGSSVLASLAHFEPPERYSSQPGVDVRVEVHFDLRGPFAGVDPDRPRFRIVEGGRVVADQDHLGPDYDYYIQEAQFLIDAIVDLRGS
jgi:hypothetical protein